ncbi:hypothetical protein EON64_19155, partial [archaeon]
MVLIANLIHTKYVQVLNKLLASKIWELLTSCAQTLWEIIVLVLWPFSPEPPTPTRELSYDDMTELVAYEEIENEDAAEGAFRRTIKAMHNYIPTNLFRATIRIHRTPSQSNSSLAPLLPRANRNDSIIGTDSPASFPPSPFSRAYVLNKSSERVVSVMFAARDRLRLEAQSVSKDEYSRMLAKEAQTSGQMAVFDPHSTSSGVALTCGQHCAVKVGKGLCCSTRAMMAIRPNTYVYFELSVTVSSSQVPTLGIGLAPPDCPLNVMVGSWPRSLGLYTDGQLLVGSHWCESSGKEKIEA